jgi:hypothetical protein
MLRLMVMQYRLRSETFLMGCPGNVTALPTGRWKIVVTEGQENPELFLECKVELFTDLISDERWVSEEKLTIQDVPDVKEYINECARCE